ncbi:MAG: acylneuraminate cytidylyltransferase family protein [Deltaproteobacteria bacterium]|nr:acylneuraminate cytidylyltransferase family protein [Deltaproteobacteria bacterium]MBW2152322.1 acylneuraminate cytidylyltransferase family protein [Deltaproteobacteria bacterium]
MNTNCSVAVIPARGGSKRLPRKNIIDFLGKPIIAYTIEAALESELFDAVIVSTEDTEIAEISMRYGARVHLRPAYLAADDVGVVDVCLDLLNHEGQKGRAFCRMACLYPTAPLRNAEDIRRVMALLKPGFCDFSMAVCAYSHPPHQALMQKDDGSLVPFLPYWVNKRSQEVPKLVVDNGSTYAVSVPAFRKIRSFYGPGLRSHFMPRERSVDIDEASDLALARYFAGQSLNKSRGL